ncbi:MAG: uroporphyrinogen decarboxylase [Dehalobacter sp. 4CP]|uniref:uroporphyrinogen decarboxylase family protein n=1 Tax=Dehalobacter sp. CP TaxID=2594474 RepID=UPI0013C71430|nr:uroporphyrinogen decarboxylase [Dehalobacter sp. 4CP]
MSEFLKRYQERMDRVFKTFMLEKADRVPVMASYGTWSSYYAGYTDAETNWDTDKCGQSLMKVANDIPCDIIHMIYSRPGSLYQALGSKAYHYLSDSNIIQYSDESANIMREDEYPEFSKDPFRFMVEKILPRKYSELAKPSPGKDLALAKGAMFFGMYGQKVGAIVGSLAGQCGMPVCFDATMVHPMDWIGDFFRGIKGIFGDIRRRPEEVLEAIHALTPLAIRLAMCGINMVPPKQYPKVLFIPIHLPTMLKTSDFDKFYWPTFKALMEFFAAHDIFVVPFYEGDWSRYYDHLQELPVKKSMGWFEHGDPKVIKEKLKNTMCITGLFPTPLLQYGTQQECIDKAKELLDVMAPDGGYIFATDKELIAPNDGKLENIIAVNKFVMEYGIY